LAPFGTSAAKMGCDAMSIVDGELKVYGVHNLRIASVLVRLTAGNTMAPCVAIGGQAAAMLQRAGRIRICTTNNLSW
jgi:choline dehydrogenase